MRRPPHELTPHVTDHAIVRYLERVKGVDLDEVRAEISAIVHRGVQLGAVCVRMDGYRYRLEGAAVVTVVPALVGSGLAPMKSEEDGQ